VHERLFQFLLFCLLFSTGYYYCHNTHQDDMSLGQVSPKLDEGSVIQDVDCGGIVAFMLALLYNPMNRQYDQDCIALEASRVKDGNNN
jgi:hypothetical protein